MYNGSFIQPMLSASGFFCLLFILLPSSGIGRNAQRSMTVVEQLQMNSCDCNNVVNVLNRS
ncbi:hypothetical protein SAMN05421736_10830 [Evansella caseinilytica]|uniref:Uncharacterized protein n=1 Tax=Evansella caseinilytica TaxID=1503961 RepID=A0A1H3RB34_9BACI|nr:hypothetical protein SAMN05421736_10830 [Evansella caseinilytica]